jgi:hypothetical protein
MNSTEGRSRHTITAGLFNTPLSTMIQQPDRRSTRKLDLTNTTDQMDLRHKCTALHPAAAQHTLLPSTYGLQHRSPQASGRGCRTLSAPGNFCVLLMTVISPSSKHALFTPRPLICGLLPPLNKYLLLCVRSYSKCWGSSSDV